MINNHVIMVYDNMILMIRYFSIHFSTDATVSFETQSLIYCKVVGLHGKD